MKDMEDPSESNPSDVLAIISLVLTILFFITYYFMREDTKEFKDAKALIGYISYGLLVLTAIFIKMGLNKDNEKSPPKN